MNTAQLNSLWANLVVEELLRLGIEHFCVCPGSRSTPLIAALATRSQGRNLSPVVIHDERGAGFHAVGYARATRKAAAVLTTSGTAAANLFPAIIEARMENLPLLAITADRPAELVGVGANQSIDQQHLFGGYPIWQRSLPAPDAAIDPRFVLATIDEAINALNENNGPVHLNCAFREPLEPAEFRFPPQLNEWLESDQPHTRYVLPNQTISQATLERIGQAISSTESGLLVIGKLANESEREAVIKLRERLRWHTYIDVNSGLPPTKSWGESPDVVLQIGGRLVGKALCTHLRSTHQSAFIQIASASMRLEPSELVTERLSGDLTVICDQITNILPQITKDVEKLAFASSNPITEPEQSISEISLAQAVSREVSQPLFVSNSMPIRDLDQYADATMASRPVASNRGASGIDGILSSAIGFCHGRAEPCTAIIGDLAFLHDANALLQLNELSHPLRIIVVNNQGGGIFSFLPIAENEPIFERYFGTPHSASFEKLASAFAISYAAPESNADLSGLLSDTQAEHVIIEVVTDRSINKQQHIGGSHEQTTMAKLPAS